MKVIIVGGGQVGAYVANLLLQSKIDVKIIDNRLKVLTKLRSEFSSDIIVEGSGSDPDVLENAGIRDADALVTLTGADEVNLVVATIAKYEYAIERVIARVNNPRNAWLFDSSMGVDVALNQADLLAHIVTDEIDMKNLATLLKINRGHHSIVQLGVGAASQGVNQYVKDLPLPGETVLISIFRDQAVIVVNGDTRIEEGDVILAFTDEQGQRLLHQMFK